MSEKLFNLNKSNEPGGVLEQETKKEIDHTIHSVDDVLSITSRVSDAISSLDESDARFEEHLLAYDELRTNYQNDVKKKARDASNPYQEKYKDFLHNRMYHYATNSGIKEGYLITSEEDFPGGETQALMHKYVDLIKDL